MRNLIIFGGGGFGAEAAWVAEDVNAAAGQPEWNILGYADDDPGKHGCEFYGFRVLGTAEEIAWRDVGRDVWYSCAVGDNAARQELAARLDGLGWRAATLIHPSVIRAKNVEVGEGTYVGPLSTLSPNCTVGRHVIVNQRVAIGHDAVVDDFSNLCPGAQINGSCRVGKLAVVGSNSSIIQGRLIGENAVLGSNSVAIRSVDAGITVLGVPAKRITL